MQGSNSVSISQPAKSSNSQSTRSGKRIRGPRFVVNKRAVLVMPRSGRPYPVLLHDVSSGGACIQTDADLSVGDDVRLRFDLNAQTTFLVQAMVTGIRPKPERFYRDYGLRFVGIDEPTQASLEAFVALRSAAERQA